MSKKTEDDTTLKIVEYAKELNVDPMMALCMALGGSAASAGFTPPLTRLFNIVGGAAGIDINADGAAFAQKYDTWKQNKQFWLGGKGSPSRWFLGGLYDIINPPPELSDTDEVKATQTYKFGMFCAGALEAALMYRVMQSPEIMKAVIAAPAEILKGVGEIVPG